MSYHICHLCALTGRDQLELMDTQEFGPISSADAILRFEGGAVYQIPWVGLPHYIQEHGYCPPQEFIDAVMSGTLAIHREPATKLARVGYLNLETESLTTGTVPKEFIQRLGDLVHRSNEWKPTSRVLGSEFLSHREEMLRNLFSYGSHPAKDDEAKDEEAEGADVRLREWLDLL